MALQPHVSNESLLQNPRIRIGTFGAEDFNGFRVTSPSGTAKYKGVFSCRSQVQKQEYIFSFRQLLFDRF